MTVSARRILLSCACAALIAAFGVTAGAQAAAGDMNPCDGAQTSQPFASWGDSAAYQLVPGGDFESASWTLAGGAQIIGDSEPFAATGSLGSGALSLPSGATATSPLICLSAAYPSLRMFAGGLGNVSVSILAGGQSIPLGTIHSGGSWAPSKSLSTNGAVNGLLNGSAANVAVQLTGVSGSPAVDDVFIDPWQRCC